MKKIKIEDVVAFHGHLCPGLAIGIRVAERAMEELGDRPNDEQLVVISETNNCAVDAIQYITGCTIGKGNLHFLEYGKNAFRFIRRSDEKMFRISVNLQFPPELTPIEKKVISNTFSGDSIAEDIEKMEIEKKRRINWILTADVDEIMSVKYDRFEIPQRAHIHESVLCEFCGEKTMEILLHPYKGDLYCTECFERIMNQGRKK